MRGFTYVVDNEVAKIYIVLFASCSRIVIRGPRVDRVEELY
jgi:hypothetical protein